ncbi:hypothetical protein [Pseudoalteromonas luteoviolacea]|uniref:Uncharacterized protein n=1 Tax=Pseudoalteromonas luteoviolacea S4060-1 TaxID=1365257 RepID=A0A162BGE7_9GAMM|nr:hypothetical protein [Pseudoalteromonas luteoviolacea]KZN61677.1 hypothetical protein N478_06310 [Pseudoalteromonas luteoviolacea S4060-1]
MTTPNLSPSDTIKAIEITSFIHAVERKRLASLFADLNGQASSLQSKNGALSAEDAANNMRDLNALLSTAAGVALANFIESGDIQYLKALENLDNQSKVALKHFIELYNTVSS